MNTSRNFRITEVQAEITETRRLRQVGTGLYATKYQVSDPNGHFDGRIYNSLSDAHSAIISSATLIGDCLDHSGRCKKSILIAACN